MNLFADKTIAFKVKFGFAATIVLILFVGVAGWIGFSTVMNKIQLNDKGDQCLNKANETGDLQAGLHHSRIQQL